MSLLPSFSGFQDILFYRSTGLSLETIYEDLSSKASFSNFDSEASTSTPPKGLVIRGRDPEKNKNTSRGGSKSCHLNKTYNYCKKKGHIKSECYKLQNNMKRENSTANQPSVSNQLAANVTPSFDSGEIHAVVECKSNASEEWILDCVCTFHTCFIREAFSSLIPSTPGIVLMGNNSPCKIEGIGKGSIKMFDEKIHTLSNVKYVLELKRNLISLGTLESQGYKFSKEGGNLKVCKGSLVVIKGHQKATNLYVLEGSTLVGDVVVDGLLHSKEDITELWCN